MNKSATPAFHPAPHSHRWRFPRWGLLLLAAILGAAILALPLPGPDARPAERTFHVQASRFEFAPALLRANPGDRVTIELTSTDVVHGLAIDGYNLSVTVDPGQTRRLQFIASRPGAFPLRCSATCGNLHPFMLGKLYVGGNALFWKTGLLSLLAVGAVFGYALLGEPKRLEQGW